LVRGISNPTTLFGVWHFTFIFRSSWLLSPYVIFHLISSFAFCNFSQ